MFPPSVPFNSITANLLSESVKRTSELPPTPLTNLCAMALSSSSKLLLRRLPQLFASEPISGFVKFKFVVVVFQDRIIMEESLSEALATVFGGDFATEDIEETEGESALELLEKATKAFEKAQQELQNGNLGLYQNLVEQAQQYVDLALELLNNN